MGGIVGFNRFKWSDVNMVNELIDQGILSYRDGLDFEEAILCVRAGLIVRRARWHWNDFMHVTSIGGATAEGPKIMFQNIHSASPVPYDVIAAIRGGDLKATDWIVYTHEQFYDNEFRETRHRASMPYNLTE
jgi:hypothetical protein